MRILYIDTTSNYLYSCYSDNEQITGKIEEQLDKDLSVFTLSRIENMLNNNNVKPKDLDKIIVVNGPGSFTGIRIGVTIAKTMAYSLNKEITTISSLQAMKSSSRKNVDYYIPIIDARRNYVFASIYDRDDNIILQEQYINLEALKVAINNLPGEYTIITNNKFDLPNIEEYKPNFENIINRYKNNKAIIAHNVDPIYLKLTEAEEKKQEEII